MEEIKNVIARNLVAYRKLAGLTQSELAEKLNYTDKSISKWERGESLPDIIVFKQIADIYGVTLDTLLSENEKKAAPEKNYAPFLKQKHFLITLMSVGIVWLVATIVFACIGMIFAHVNGAWMVFIFAIPISFIIFTIFSFIWGHTGMQTLSMSGLLWTIALTLFLMIDNPHIWLVFICPIPFQVLALMWLIFKKKFSKKKSV